MLIKKMTESMISNRIEWQKRIHLADLDQFIEDPQPTPNSCQCFILQNFWYWGVLKLKSYKFAFLMVHSRTKQLFICLTREQVIDPDCFHNHFDHVYAQLQVVEVYYFENISQSTVKVSLMIVQWAISFPPNVFLYADSPRSSNFILECYLA